MAENEKPSYDSRLEYDCVLRDRPISQTNFKIIFKTSNIKQVKKEKKKKGQQVKYSLY